MERKTLMNAHRRVTKDAQPARAVLVGAGGYGGFYAKALLHSPQQKLCQLAGVVDPSAEQSMYFAELTAAGIPVYNTLEQFFAGHYADLAVISSPIHLHCRHTCAALKSGANVLCEKPLGATVQEARRMIRTRDNSGLLVAIGYQWSFSRAIQEMKKENLLHL